MQTQPREAVRDHGTGILYRDGRSPKRKRGNRTPRKSVTVPQR
jgi:hypothetical protein